MWFLSDSQPGALIPRISRIAILDGPESFCLGLLITDVNTVSLPSMVSNSLKQKWRVWLWHLFKISYYKPATVCIHYKRHAWVYCSNHVKIKQNSGYHVYFFLLWLCRSIHRFIWNTGILILFCQSTILCQVMCRLGTTDLEDDPPTSHLIWNSCSVFSALHTNMSMQTTHACWNVLTFLQATLLV